ncbi:uracil-DNA glycosylase [Cantharellus anzutake]|uniref:uracil-DNA glycosylase n=1 Tax=Cantharellus anzutake TaxID=1750568 RepID=UPI001907825B|nr:uracil-DNA glycosylase [Cantharellus anzutake]KAF8342122.1 uracil-DNA glycosylase [Cantharellus anzutake]
MFGSANKKAKTNAGAVVTSTSESSDSVSPKPVARKIGGVTPFNAIPLNLDTFTTSLDEEEKRLLSLECATMGRTWLKVLTSEIRKPYFIQLKRFLWSEGVEGSSDQSKKSPKIFPPPKDIYNWSRATELGKLKVVIIGQDPYHGPGQAHGLCFSVRKGVQVPPSLKNMYQEIASNYPGFEPPKHGDLTSWAQQGVLLINSSLTVRAGAPASHANKGWELFTDTVISLIDKYGGRQGLGSLSKTNGGIGRGVVFLAWGAPAGKRVAKLDKKKHLILTSAHPSPLSVHRGFFGNGHFKKANDWLQSKYGVESVIDWCKLD